MCIGIVCICALGDVLSIQWRAACDQSRHHRAAFISALMYGLGLLDLMLVVHDWRFIAPVLIGEVSGSYLGIWLKDRFARSEPVAVEPPVQVADEPVRRLHVV